MTKDRIRHFSCDVNMVCCLCGVADKIVRHFFFDCPFSSCVLRDVFSRLELPCDGCEFSYWNASFVAARHPDARVLCLCASAFTLCIYRD